ncbi:hypothetical protein WA577_004520, partial [Blastocystis sp. JDR]
MMVAAGYRNWGLNVSFIDDSIMTTLNRVHRHKDASTDILSFPAHTKVERPGKLPCTRRTKRDLGDIFISTPYISAYCEENQVNIWDHLNVLYAHGISHLLGFDHEKDEDYALMAPFEKKLL